MKYNFKKNKEALEALNIINNTSRHLFLTGKAGTGKSTLLHHIKETIKKKHIVLAPTGIAALNVGGQTIHSFYQLSFRPYLPDDRDLPHYRKDKINLLKKLEVVIIDEISMVRADVMQAIDLTLRRYLNGNKPFGGLQLVLIGDLMQLPPVVDTRKVDETQILKDSYDSPFFFSAKSFPSLDIEIIELQKVYRQKDMNFKSVLEKIRKGSYESQDLAIINSRVIPHHKVGAGEITLSTTNHKVRTVNEKELAKLKTPVHKFFAWREGSFENKQTWSCPTDICLELKVGAQVMFIKNDKDPKKRWVNGSIGIVTELDKGLVEVELNGEKHELFKEEWEDVKYTLKDGAIQEEVIGLFKQFPLKLAWAVTIHKSQGQTFDKVFVDMSGGAFVEGQTYVALSRCTSLEGMTLKNPIRSEDVLVSEDALDFMNGIDINVEKYEDERFQEIADLKKENEDLRIRLSILEGKKQFDEAVEDAELVPEGKLRDFDIKKLIGR